ncbi:hypothetical protein BC828DRAFT_377995 [Blastocladiella britannica]|nr:hypothetical protein BC828DRAFT_377995 [Blastocladiella britannica]
MHPISSLLALVALCTFGATAAPAYYVPECAQGSESPKCWAVASPIYNDEPCTGSGNGGAVPTATPTYTWKPTPTSTPYTTDIATPSSSSSAAATSSAPASYPRPAPTAGASRNVVAYFANWKQSYQVTDLPVEDLTHVIYVRIVISSCKKQKVSPAKTYRHSRSPRTASRC